VVTRGTYLNSLATGATPTASLTSEACGGGCACGSCGACTAMRAGKLTVASVAVGGMLTKAVQLSHTMLFAGTVNKHALAKAPLLSEAAAVMAWTLLPPVVDMMDAFAGSLTTFGGPTPGDRYDDAMRIFVGLAVCMEDGVQHGGTPLGVEELKQWPQARVLFRHLVANPRVLQAGERLKTGKCGPQFAQLVGRWLSELRPAGAPTAAGADYARLQVPDWSSLHKPSGCSNPRCLNAAGESEASLPTKKCSECGLRYCCRACQAAAYKVHKHVCGGKAAEWFEKASG
jgi:hypothetical protein